MRASWWDVEVGLCLGRQHCTTSPSSGRSCPLHRSKSYLMGKSLFSPFKFYLSDNFYPWISPLPHLPFLNQCVFFFLPCLSAAFGFLFSDKCGFSTDRLILNKRRDAVESVASMAFLLAAERVQTGSYIGLDYIIGDTGISQGRYVKNWQPRDFVQRLFPEVFALHNYNLAFRRDSLFDF